MKVHGEKGARAYVLNSGVDIAPDENLELTCRITNESSEALNVSPRFMTYRRSIDSGILVETPSRHFDAIQLQSGEVKDVSLILPHAAIPQAYDAALTFFDQNNQQVSNAVIAHYVVQGASGTLQNILLDKDAYVSGDTALITLSFSGSADGFPGARGGEEGTRFEDAKIEVTLKTTEGIICGEAISKILAIQQLQQTVSLPVNVACQYPIATARLFNATNGTMLDEISASLVPDKIKSSHKQSGGAKNYTEEKSAGSRFEKPWMFVGIILFVTGGCLVLLLVRLWRVRKHGALLVAFFSVLSAIWIGNMGVAQADTIVVDPHLRGTSFGYMAITYTLDKARYSVGDTMTARASGQYLDCLNGTDVNLTVSVNPNVNFSGYTNLQGVDLGIQQILNSHGAGYHTYTKAYAFGVDNSWKTGAVNVATFHFYMRVDWEGGLVSHLNYYRDLPYALYPNPSVDLTLNGEGDDVVSVLGGSALPLSWTVSDADSCVASGYNFFGARSTTGGSESYRADQSTTLELSCTGPGGAASDTVSLSTVCIPNNGAWGSCDCVTETKSRSVTRADCTVFPETTSCSSDEKNSCRNFNYREVTP